MFSLYEAVCYLHRLHFKYFIENAILEIELDKHYILTMKQISLPDPSFVGSFDMTLYLTDKIDILFN